jgi:hypothetical protein
MKKYGAMPSMKPESASDPDGENGWRYRDLAETDADLALRLLREYGEVWLIEAELPVERLAEVQDTVELVVANEWEESDPQSMRLRLTSWYTGSTYWLPGWDRDHSAAVAWIRDIAQLQAGNVRTQRFRYGNTPWDLQQVKRTTDVTPEEFRAWLKDDAERHPQR